MGCVSSKLTKKEIIREIRLNHGVDDVNHVVSLTSTTYGFLKLEQEQQQQQKQEQEQEEPVKEVVVETKKTREEPEIINAWELMEGLEEGVPASNYPVKRGSPKLLRGLLEKSRTSPMKFASSEHKIYSPKKGKRFGGKENSGSLAAKENKGFSPKQVLRPNNFSQVKTPNRSVLRLSFPLKGEDSVLSSQRRSKSFSPLFDPDLVASYERELCDEKEQIKMVISPAPETCRLAKKSQESERILRKFEQKCPPGGENSVVIYTTTLRGIRKTFEDCNTVRSIVESHHILVSERDVSMHSGFRDEIRGLMGTKEVRVPLVFVKGRLVGGVEEIVKLEEEGKLGILFEGLQKGMAAGCQGCGGVRFLMCMECNGSCKVRDEVEKKVVRCGECNENGLILCPICC